MAAAFVDESGHDVSGVRPETLPGAKDSLALLEMSLLQQKRLGVSIAEGVLNAQQSVDEAARAVEALGAPATAGTTV